jgi:hypothetical protein
VIEFPEGSITGRRHRESAPVFVVIDTGSGEVAEVINRDLRHAHGAFQLRRLAAGGKLPAETGVGPTAVGCADGICAGVTL